MVKKLFLTRKRKLLVYSALIVLMLFLAAALVDQRTYGRFIAGRLQTLALQSGSRVTFENPRLSLTGLKADAITLVPGRTLLAIYATDVRVTPDLLTLFRSTLDLNIEGVLYGGTFHGSVSQPFTGGDLKGRLQLADMRLADHPQLQGLGITSGTLSVEDLALHIESNQLSSASGKLALKDLTKDGLSVLPGPSSSSSPLIIPEIDTLSLQTRLTYALPEIDLNDIEISSPLGQLKGTARLKDLNNAAFARAENVMVTASAVGGLSSKGHTLLGPLLTAYAGLKSPLEKDAEITVELRGSLVSPRTIIKTGEKAIG